MNAITLRNGRQLEDPIGKANPSEVEKESNEPQGEETRVESEKPATPAVTARFFRYFVFNYFMCVYLRLYVIIYSWLYFRGFSD